MVGFTLLSRSYYYLRRRSPGPPFPPDHRQAGERGARNPIKSNELLSQNKKNGVSDSVGQGLESLDLA
jgi:hypothetical protein